LPRSSLARSHSASHNFRVHRSASPCRLPPASPTRPPRTCSPLHPTVGGACTRHGHTLGGC
jgi:hypothetical protein